MKKANLLSRAEMRKIMGGNPLLLGCDVTCYDWTADATQWHESYFNGRYATYTPSCSVEHIALACGLASPVSGSCRNCTYDMSPPNEE